MDAAWWTESLHDWVGWLWLILMAVWVIGMVRTKRTVERQTDLSRLGQIAMMAAAFVLLSRSSMPMGHLLDHRLFAESLGTAAAGFALGLCGLLVSVWARVTLGTNWSGTVTLKEGHTLVQRGPYQFVRHPIYTGILLMILGSAMDYRALRSFLAVVVCGVGFWWKMQNEEQFMVQEFGEQYEVYRREVKTLVPFVF